jgi:hypothetical protein
MLAVCAAIMGLSGCGDPAPTPTPTSTGFASEAEAFAAAEETYRAYVDALNRVDLSDPATFEDVYQWTTGDLNASDRESFSMYHAESFTVIGDTEIRKFTPQSYDPATVTVTAVACSDVSQIDVLDAEGNSQVAANRPDLYQLIVTFESAEVGSSEFLIASSNAVEPDQCDG